MNRLFSFASGALPLGSGALLMGILNITPDSFYDGGRYFVPENAVKRAVEIAEEGADIIDIGALSTRPNAARASEEEELRRLRSVLPLIRKELRLPISVDTYRPAVIRYALSEGADIINDVSGRFSLETAALVKEYGAGWVLMHAGPMGAKTETAAEYPLGVVNHVQLFFDAVKEQARACGVTENQLCLDPGFGFAKTNEQNAELLRGFSLLRTGGAALLCALSRKRFIRASAVNESDEAVLYATLAADIAAVGAGADILRVHDVAVHKAALGAYNALFTP